MPRDDVIGRLLNALHTGDDLALTSLLDNNARMIIDTNDDTGGVVTGRLPCASRLHDLQKSFPDATFVAVQVNGEPGLALRSPDGFDSAVVSVAHKRGGLITALWLFAAPQKLEFWNRQRRSRGRNSLWPVTDGRAVWSELEQDAEPPSPFE